MWKLGFKPALKANSLTQGSNPAGKILNFCFNLKYPTSEEGAPPPFLKRLPLLNLENVELKKDVCLS